MAVLFADTFYFIALLDAAGDLSFTGPFGDIRGAAGASGGQLQPYPKFFEKVKHSAFPPHFLHN